jgi:PAS domain S-box-containing protein
VLAAEQSFCFAGKTPEELLGQSAWVFYATDDEHTRAEHALYDNLRERGRSCVDTNWQRKDGSVVDVLMSAAPLDIGDSKEWQIVTVLNVTDKKQADPCHAKTRRIWPKHTASLIWEVTPALRFWLTAIRCGRRRLGYNAYDHLWQFVA